MPRETRAIKIGFETLTFEYADGDTTISNAADWCVVLPVVTIAEAEQIARAFLALFQRDTYITSAEARDLYGVPTATFRYWAKVSGAKVSGEWRMTMDCFEEKRAARDKRGYHYHNTIDYHRDEARP